MRVLVIGGYGAFGRRIAARLQKIEGVTVIIGGRSNRKCMDMPSTIYRRIDKMDSNMANILIDLKADLVIHTAGPFDGNEKYNVAKACIQVSRNGAVCNYIDIADNWSYVQNIVLLNAEAVDAGCVLLSGASTTPAVTSAAIEYFSPGLFGDISRKKLNSLGHVECPRKLEVYISVANSAMPGEGTVRSILRYCGKRLNGLKNGVSCDIFGWSELSSSNFFGIGARRLCSDIESADGALLIGLRQGIGEDDPGRCGSLEEFRFAAGVESAVSMVGLSAMSRLCRSGIVSDWTNWSSSLLYINSWLRRLSPKTEDSDGGMIIRVEGLTGELGEGMTKLGVTWGILASEKTGPEIPCTPAVLLARKLQSGASRIRPGARPCVGEFGLDDFTACVREEGIDLQQYVHYEQLQPSPPTVANPRNPQPTNGFQYLQSMSPLLATMDWTSQKAISPELSRVFNYGGVAVGNLRILETGHTMAHRFARYFVGLYPTGYDEVNEHRVVMDINQHVWKRSISMCGRKVDLHSVFSMLTPINFLVENICRNVKIKYVQKNMTVLEALPSDTNAFAMISREMLLFGYLPIPFAFSRVIYEHSDGRGWDVREELRTSQTGVSLLHTQASYRVVSLLATNAGYQGSQVSDDIPMTMADIVEVARHMYGEKAVRIPHEGLVRDWKKVIGKTVLIFDGDCGLCNSLVQWLITRDARHEIVFCSSNSRTAGELLEVLGVKEGTFQQMKDETIFVIDCFGGLLTHAHAVAALGRIIYPWSSTFFSMIPLTALRPAYSMVARNRYRLGLSKKKVENSSSCQRTAPEEYSRIIL